MKTKEIKTCDSCQEKKEKVKEYVFSPEAEKYDLCTECKAKQSDRYLRYLDGKRTLIQRDRKKRFYF